MLHRNTIFFSFPRIYKQSENNFGTDLIKECIGGFELQEHSYDCEYIHFKHQIEIKEACILSVGGLLLRVWE